MDMSPRQGQVCYRAQKEQDEERCDCRRLRVERRVNRNHSHFRVTKVANVPDYFLPRLWVMFWFI